MANNKLKQLADVRGVTEEWYIDHIVVPMVNTHGQQEAARQLGVSQAAVSGWLKDKYTPHVWWLKAATPEETRRINELAARYQLGKEELA